MIDSIPAMRVAETRLRFHPRSRRIFQLIDFLSLLLKGQARVRELNLQWLALQRSNPGPDLGDRARRIAEVERQNAEIGILLTRYGPRRA